MWIKAYIRYTSDTLFEYRLRFKNGKIQQTESQVFNGIKLFDNSSTLAHDIVIKKTKVQNYTNKYCKYVIKKTLRNQPFLMYLDITILEYWLLSWQLHKKKFFKKSNTSKTVLLLIFILLLL